MKATLWNWVGTVVMATVLVVVAGCGTNMGATSNADGPASQGVPGPQGPQGIPGDTSLLSWAVFDGVPATRVLNSGGHVSVRSLRRTSEGQYTIVYDVRTSQVGNVAVVASGVGARSVSLFGSDSGAIVLNVVQVQGVSLTIEVSVVSVSNEGDNAFGGDNIFGGDNAFGGGFGSLLGQGDERDAEEFSVVVYGDIR